MIGDSCAHTCIKQSFPNVIPSCFILGSHILLFPTMYMEISGHQFKGFSVKWCAPDPNLQSFSFWKKIKLCSHWYVLHFLYVTIMIFFLLSSSHSLMKTLNKLGFAEVPKAQVPGIFQVVWLLFIMTFFFPYPFFSCFQFMWQCSHASQFELILQAKCFMVLST